MPTLQEKLVQEFENLQRNYPYLPYGAGVKRKAEELIKKGKELHRLTGKEWDLRKSFSDDELRMIINDSAFARKVLSKLDPAFKNKWPTSEEVEKFRNLVNLKESDRLYPGVRPGEQYPVLTPSQIEGAEESFKTKLSSGEDFIKRAERMLEQTSRLAPLSPLHTTAKRMLERNDPKDSIRLGREEIAAAGRTNVPREISPYLDKASETPEAFLKQYEINYAPVIENFRREAAKDFLERDIPTINNHFAHKGAFYSGAREAALNKARADKEERIEREIAKLLTHAREEGMKNYHQNRSHHLKQAEVSGHAHQAEKDSHLRAAEALRVNSMGEQAALHQQATALSQMARTEQQQAQNELNIRQQEYREEMERPFIELAKKASIAQGHPAPHPNLSPESINPPPPSVYGMGAGILGQMAGLMGQPVQQTAAHGGSIRKKYASGDSVARAASQLQQMRQHIPQSPEEDEMRQSAQSFKNYKANPMADYLFTLGSNMLSDLNNPMKAYGEGALLGMRAYKAAEGANLSAQEKYYNLMNKINQSKMDQQSFLSKHHATMLAQEEMLRHHAAQEDETRRYHDLAMENYGKVKSSAKKKSVKELEFEDDAENGLEKALEAKEETKHLRSLLKKSSTGPVIGSVKGILPRTKIDNQIEVGTNKLILDMHQAMTNIPRAEAFMKRIETTKPNIRNYSEANEDSLNYIDRTAEIGIRTNISRLLAAGWHPKEIEKRFKIKIPEHLLTRYGQTDMSPEDGSIVHMIDPDGNPLMVPQDQIEEALSLGASLAE